MATSPGSLTIVSTEINSFIRGYHAYKDEWTPVIGEELILRCELNNPKDDSAVSVIKDGQIVGHVPYNLSNIVTQFLRRTFNTGFAEVTGQYVNRGAGYGLEVPCVYKFYGPKPFISKLQSLFKSLQDKGLL